ncbi:hypothetical protein IWQ62_001354 [Dispira parvispora]|uniref:Uncharacterized protein n=1 Tax=Dispira parvispora TaxID=1520584 RepID=A0A9W8E958_9FUNG|nr:hypothetical protein IWQ62_001354 [Dispira parvispora]
MRYILTIVLWAILSLSVTCVPGPSYRNLIQSGIKRFTQSWYRYKVKKHYTEKRRLEGSRTMETTVNSAVSDGLRRLENKPKSEKQAMKDEQISYHLDKAFKYSQKLLPSSSK